MIQPVWVSVVCMTVMATLLSGCGVGIRALDEEELRDTRVQKALLAEEKGDEAAAIAAYREAVAADPGLARGHLGLALLLDRPGGDFVLAVYHYRRYLDLRPDTEKRGMIEERLSGARRAAVAAWAAAESSGPAEAVAGLRAENANLKKWIQDLEEASDRVKRELAQARAEAQARKILPGEADLEAAYIVRKGDTLSGIAGKVYGDASRWREIFEVNKKRLKSQENVQPGQILIIPR